MIDFGNEAIAFCDRFVLLYIGKKEGNWVRLLIVEDNVDLLQSIIQILNDEFTVCENISVVYSIFFSLPFIVMFFGFPVIKTFKAISISSEYPV